MQERNRARGTCKSAEWEKTDEEGDGESSPRAYFAGWA
jgi:hypothetical protein